MHTRPSSLPRHVISFSSFLFPVPRSSPLSFFHSLLVLRSFCSARLFPSFPRATTQTRDEKIKQRRSLGPSTEPSAEGGGMGEGGKRHRPPPLPVSEIKRRGRNLAEGCKYYKVTLRRMRELKGLPREGGKRAPEDNASE